MAYEAINHFCGQLITDAKQMQNIWQAQKPVEIFHNAANMTSAIKQKQVSNVWQAQYVFLLPHGVLWFCATDTTSYWQYPWNFSKAVIFQKLSEEKPPKQCNSAINRHLTAATTHLS